MRTERLAVTLPALPNNTPEYLSRPTPKNAFPLHLLSAIIGGRGSGKTTFALSLLEMYDKSKSFDRIVFFSTTASKDPKVKAFIEDPGHNAEVSVHDGYSDALLQQEMDRMEADRVDWVRYKAHIEVWHRYCRCRNTDNLSVEDLITLEEMGYEKPEPPYPAGMVPCTCVVFDDLLGSKVFSVNMTGVANKLTISHRHYSCSVLVLSQSFTSFIPRPVRTGNIGLWVLFACRSDNATKEIAEDVASKASPNQVLRAWRFATEKPHTPLVIDYDTHDDNRRFRRGLNTLIIFDDEKPEAEPLSSEGAAEPAK